VRGWSPWSSASLHERALTQRRHDPLVSSLACAE
jgi:hypothetical protein